MRQKRTRVWIDRFQTSLSVRLAGYFVLYQVALWSLFWINGRLTMFGESVGWSGSAAGVLLTPLLAIGLALIFIFDAAKETHRVVGPLYRIRNTIQAVTAGGEVSLVGLRSCDHLQELKDDLNAMLRALEERGVITISEKAADQQPVGA
jgi:hypothetical protein